MYLVVFQREINLFQRKKEKRKLFPEVLRGSTDIYSIQQQCNDGSAYPRNTSSSCLSLDRNI
jgi:hypothetical protein